MPPPGPATPATPTTTVVDWRFLQGIKARFVSDLIKNNHITYTLVLAQAQVVLDTLHDHEDSDLWVAFALLSIRLLVAIVQQYLDVIEARNAQLRSHTPRTDGDTLALLRQFKKMVQLLRKILDWCASTMIVILVFMATAFCKKVMGTSFAVPLVMCLSMEVFKIWVNPENEDGIDQQRVARGAGDGNGNKNGGDGAHRDPPRQGPSTPRQLTADADTHPLLGAHRKRG